MRGRKATFSLVDGRRDPNGAELSALNDGLLPTEEDQPSANFFFLAGSGGGRIGVDLGAAVEIAAINSYSWHPGGRGPQVYTVYASPGSNAGFAAAPTRPTDPTTCGWVRLAKVDTRAAADSAGGQYGVSLSGANGALGTFRHLLFDIQPTDPSDPFGQTFFSEIDIIDHNAAAEPEPEALAADTGAHRKTIQVEGDVEVIVDTTETPDLTESGGPEADADDPGVVSEDCRHAAQRRLHGAQTGSASTSAKTCRAWQRQAAPGSIVRQTGFAGN